MLATAIQNGESAVSKEVYLEAFKTLEESASLVRWDLSFDSDAGDGSLDLSTQAPSTIVRLKSRVKSFKASSDSPYLQFLYPNDEIEALDLSHFSNLSWLIGQGVSAQPSKSLTLNTLKVERTIPLKKLILDNTLIEKFDFSNYPELEEVQLNYSDKLQSINSSKELNHFKKITITNANWAERQKVKTADEHEEVLTIDSKKVFSTINLSMYKNLEEIDLSNNHFLSEIGTDKELSWVKKLMLNNTGIKKLDLTLFPNLEELNVSDCNQLTQIVSRGALYQLKKMILRNSALQTFELAECKRLEEIFIQNSDQLLTKITFNGSMPALRKLSVIKKSHGGKSVEYEGKILVIGINNCTHADLDKSKKWMVTAEKDSLTQKVFDLGHSLQTLRDKLQKMDDFLGQLKTSLN